MRNERLPTVDRRAARVALAKVYGLELNKAQIRVEKDPLEL